MIAEKSTCRSCGAFYAPGYIIREEGVCLFCGKKRIMPNSTLSNEEILDEIRLLLLDSIDNLCGGLVASEIRLGLQDKGMYVSSQKIVNLIRHRGKHIKIQKIAVETKWLNLYYTDPPLDLEEVASC